MTVWYAYTIGIRYYNILKKVPFLCAELFENYRLDLHGISFFYHIDNVSKTRIGMVVWHMNTWWLFCNYLGWPKFSAENQI